MDSHRSHRRMHLLDKLAVAAGTCGPGCHERVYGNVAFVAKEGGRRWARLGRHGGHAGRWRRRASLRLRLWLWLRVLRSSATRVWKSMQRWQCGGGHGGAGVRAQVAACHGRCGPVSHAPPTPGRTCVAVVRCCACTSCGVARLCAGGMDRHSACRAGGPSSMHASSRVTCLCAAATTDYGLPFVWPASHQRLRRKYRGSIAEASGASTAGLSDPGQQIGPDDACRVHTVFRRPQKWRSGSAASTGLGREIELASTA